MRYNEIYENREYKEILNKIEYDERERKFCRHSLTHFLDVARIAYIINLEENYGIEKELIYATALLHDIGRDEQYRKGISHEKASAEIAEKILKECQYSEEEREKIIKAILSHREERKSTTLGEIIYKADKLSRICSECKSREECYWKEEKKNKKLYY